MASDDPEKIRFLAVTVEDVVTALELNLTTTRRAVLRVTPPFSGRMRARLHVLDRDSDSVTLNRDRDSVTDGDAVTTGAGLESTEDTIHLDPRTLISGTVPSYPAPAETEDALRSDPEETYTVDRHHDRHREVVSQWRREVADAIAASTTIQTPAGPHEVDITALGDCSFVDSTKRSERCG